MALTLETLTVDLAGGPVDLVSQQTVAAALADGRPPEKGIRLILQNIGTTKIFYRETLTEPDAGDPGHCLNPSDVLTLQLWAMRGNVPAKAWVWARSTGTAALSESRI